ncbi:MAG TPA: hypothetical protein VE868_01680 [Balneolaceae bacterium]|nr:hypothetical protein [Balneolaceae bacterium]
MGKLLDRRTEMIIFVFYHQPLNVIKQVNYKLGRRATLASNRPRCLHEFRNHTMRPHIDLPSHVVVAITFFDTNL